MLLVTRALGANGCSALGCHLSMATQNLGTIWDWLLSPWVPPWSCLKMRGPLPRPRVQDDQEKQETHEGSHQVYNYGAARHGVGVRILMHACLLIVFSGAPQRDSGLGGAYRAEGT